MEKELIACEDLWKDILLIEDFVWNVVFFDSILLESELNSDKSYEILWDKKSHNFIMDQTQIIENNRIYISDRLYWLFFTYRAIFLRVYNLYHKWKENRNIVKFSHDDWIKQHLKTFIINESEIDSILNKESWWLSYINNILKNMILVEIKEVKSKSNSYIKAWTHIQAWWDIIVWNNNKNNENWNNWQNNLKKFIPITVIMLIIWTVITIWWNYVYSNFQENKKIKEEFVLNYKKLTEILIPYIKPYSCSWITVNNDTERKELIDKSNEVNDLKLKLQTNYSKINNSIYVSNFPEMLDRLIVSLNTQCKDFEVKEKNLNMIYSSIINK